MYFDTHSHINTEAFALDADKVIKRALDHHTSLVIIGTDYKSSKKALEQANRYESGVWAAIGLHPQSLQSYIEETADGPKEIPAEKFNFDMYATLAKFPKTVAIGEIGLDYSWRETDLDIEAIKREQKLVLSEQLLLARRFDLPAIIHCRQAHDDLLPLLQNFRHQYKEMIPKDRPWGVIHCFSGDENLAWQYFNLGLIISFTGLITFSQRWDELIRKIPADKIMIETDSPYMTPEPHRGKRNEPVLVRFVAERIAEIRGVSVDNIAQMTTANAKQLFKLK
ncbi:TatD family hydrolase [Candidatus Falkowbacteria bacterium]|nr:MAG: TatD family hydrolase [Candidatus Falkowbacteria bacterium]